jgi:protein phosphatase
MMQLAPTFQEPIDLPAIRVAAVTDVGRVREQNEDALIVLDLATGATIEPGGELVAATGADVLLAVADGMGGHDDGALASASAVCSLAASMSGPPDPRHELAGPMHLRDAVARAHEEVGSLAAASSGRRRMGTTLTAVHVRGPRAYVAHVGDSRAYVLRGSRLELLTHDHSYTQMLVDNDILCSETVDLSPFPSTLLQVIGQAQPLEIDVASLELRDGDWLVLCSDGLTKHVSDAEIERALVRAADPAAAARTLLDLALLRGGQDNVTAIVAAVGGGLPAPDEPFSATFRVLAAYEPPPISWRAMGGLE